MMTKILGILVALTLFGLCLWATAQQQTVRQTDPEDMRTRQRIDSDIYEQMRLMNWNIQADTTILDGGDTRDTVYLPDKYEDVDYFIFVRQRWDNAGDLFRFSSWGLTDSSFVIRHNLSQGDSCSVAWMTLHD